MNANSPLPSNTFANGTDDRMSRRARALSWIDPVLMVIGFSILTLLRLPNGSQSDPLQTRWLTVGLLVYGGWTCSRFAAMTISLVALSIWCGIEWSQQEYWVGLTVGQLVRYVVATWIVWWSSGIRASMRLAHEVARVDSLTGLANRRAVEEVLESELSRMRRSGRPFTLVMLDCDGFKAINDTEGHASGDDVLRRTGAALRGNTRRYDCIGRLGGDEFVLILPETDSTNAELVLERLRAALRHQVERLFPTLTYSIGVVTFLSGDLSMEDCLRQADDAMYASKRAGKNQTKFFTYNAPVSPASVAASK